uniref:Uncharacterized protein n=1 Tax=Oryza sativa subsp. japonica TaxID=39947 RepID=Q6YUN5_ORYSJ|nr:hypothetical protein [Oryza sativa Japonica Group]BAD17559.1 hypothetical protein [Oryza sativa Japonica Group]
MENILTGWRLLESHSERNGTILYRIGTNTLAIVYEAEGFKPKPPGDLVDQSRQGSRRQQKAYPEETEFERKS